MQVAEVAHLEKLGTEGAAFAQQLRCDSQGCLEELRLQVLINLMETRDIRCSIADNEIGLPSVEDLVYRSHGLFCCDVALQDRYPFYRGHLLQVNGDNLDVAGLRGLPTRFIRLVELAGQNLRPTARCRTQVNRTVHAREYIELFIYLQKLIGGARTEALCFGFPIVWVALTVESSLEELPLVLDF